MTIPEMCETLEGIAIGLASAERRGTMEDDPEGARYITLSDTLAALMEADIFEIIAQLWLVEE